MMLNAIRFLSMVLTAVAMTGAFAHLFELPNKIGMSRDDYLTAQRLYRGWALLGIPAVGALVSTATLTVMVRRSPVAFFLPLGATVCIGLALAVFFVFTYPANQQTNNWTMLPENWEVLRRRWEYSHAAGAVLYFAAFVNLTLSLLIGRD